MQLVPFTYASTGHTGYVPEEAAATFRAKDAAMLAVKAGNDGAISRIISANRRIKRAGWYFYTEDTARHYAARGHFTLIQGVPQ